MSETIHNSLGADTEAAVISNADGVDAEISNQASGVDLATEATEPQVHPAIEHMKKVERALFGPPDRLLDQIDKGELGVNDTDFEDRTALMIMTARGHTEAVKELLTRNADVNRINMYQGRIPMSALDAARQTGQKDIEQLLLENGAKSGRELQAEQIVSAQGK